MPKVFLFDLDGTLADCTHRLHFIKQEKKDWKAFFSACVDDTLIEDVAWFARLLGSIGSTVVYMSGRSDEVRQQTEDWLEINNLPFGLLYMRKAGDHRPDYIVKSELLDEVLKMFPAIAGVFDDRQRVVDMYRKRGLRVYQVAEGDF
jgi:FMN phosphatase YigB (HAD superfamily)